MKILKSIVALSFLGTSWLVPAQSTDTVDKQIEEQVVIGVRDRLERAGVLKDVVEQTEIIGSDQLENTRSLSLTEAMEDAPGVVIANECSMCGYKRIQLNGLKAEHTNIFNDGLPTHTIVSGFYAVDAIAMTGVERIEVARGSGASMTAPEAIGGVVNIISVERNENSGAIDISAGEEGFSQIGLLGTLVALDERLRFTFTGQRDERDQFDADDNGVSENPYMKNESYSARASWDVSDFDNVVFRLGRSEQVVFGGPILGSVTPSISAAIASESQGEAAQLFAGNDVRTNWVGNAWETSEWVASERVEYSASWLREINDALNMTLSLSGSDHEQDSFYEGFDYVAEDEMLYLDARFNYALNDRHLITFGADNRNEEMRTRSESGEANPDYVSDSFDYDVSGFYIQDTWAVNDKLEVKLALRFDQIEADFVDPAKPGVEIDENIFSPRLDARYMHNDKYTSRFSAGRGYRAPLSFFETDHGILDAEVGFEVDVDELERSSSFGYALSYEGTKLSATGAISHTKIDNLSALDETDAGVPLLTQLDEEASITSMDITLGYKAAEGLDLSITAEVFDHDDAFKSSFGVATTEEKIIIAADWEVAGWDVYASASWIGSRDLTDYGYEGFNDAALTIAKTTDAPAFSWVDVRVSRNINDNLSLYAGANNLFDQTQAGDDDSPLVFLPDGGYDVAYIYGLMRGRELYAGLQYEF